MRLEMTVTRYASNEIEAKLSSALARLLSQDAFLLEHEAHERSVAHKLAEYLQQEFGHSRNVDCEYDLHGRELKRLDGLLGEVSECAEQRATNRILPDIIVHVRDTDDFNTLVVELKTQRRSVACDIRKLELMTTTGSGYGYQRGALIQFNGLEQPTIRWFPNERG